MEFTVQAAAATLADCTRILVFTGAGISTESGIPDFRSPGGLWTRLNPDDFTLSRYLNDPAVRAKSWVARFPRLFGEAAPNPAHDAVVDLWKAGRMIGCVTQNIDGLHQAAGLPLETVAELHGNADGIACVSCAMPADVVDVEARWDAGDHDPRCSSCGGILKTTVVFFEEMLPAGPMEQAHTWVSEADAVISVGSSLSVFPAAYIPLEVVGRGFPLVIVNQGPTEFDVRATVRLRGKAGTILPELVTALSRS
jgi:NAD-dependent deacetylase